MKLRDSLTIQVLGSKGGKVMKRNAVSLLLAICFVLFLIPSAAAAQTVQLQLNKPVTVDDIASFTPAGR